MWMCVRQMATWTRARRMAMWEWPRGMAHVDIDVDQGDAPLRVYVEVGALNGDVDAGRAKWRCGSGRAE